MSKPVISRYLSPATYEAVRNDFVFLIDKIKESGFEYGLQIRDDYFNLYYKGNSIGKISYKSGQKVYEIKIHRKFVDDSIVKRFSPMVVKDYAVFVLPSKQLHPLFSSKNLLSMGQRVKAVQFQEEIVFEQMLLTDNIGRKDLIIIDRQVVDRHSSTKMDLLALKRNDAGKYQFCILEVKLGNNLELKEMVFAQLSGYIDRIAKNFQQYKECYEKNVAQKRGLGLLPDVSEVDIVEGVMGVVVVGGYSGLAEKSIGELKTRHPEIKVLHIKNVIDLSRVK
jgi:hypothetical protein